MRAVEAVKTVWNLYGDDVRELYLRTFEDAQHAIHLKVCEHRRIATLSAGLVVIDLDETLIDNSVYSDHLCRSGLTLSTQRAWDDYCRAVDPPLLPGAKKFIYELATTFRQNDTRLILGLTTSRFAYLRRVTQRTLESSGLLLSRDRMCGGETVLSMRSNSSRGIPEIRRKALQIRGMVKRFPYPVIALMGDLAADHVAQISNIDTAIRPLLIHMPVPSLGLVVRRILDDEFDPWPNA